MKDFRDLLLGLGVKLEDVRYFLPFGTPSAITITMNARSWMHFFSLRLSVSAQTEIRELVQMILNKFRPTPPILWRARAKCIHSTRPTPKQKSKRKKKINICYAKTNSYHDIIHELVHVRQFQERCKLFDEDFDYVERPTEVEASGIAEEARGL